MGRLKGGDGGRGGRMEAGVHSPEVLEEEEEETQIWAMRV